MPAIDPAAFETFLATAEPPELDAKTRPGVEPATALNEKLRALFGRDSLSPGHEELIRALVLLWHDHLHEAHEIAQSIENADGAFVHGIMHRREPDYGNAKYWFRRVGNHPAFPEIAKRVSALCKAKSAEGLLGQLVRNGQWDSFAMVDACEQSCGRAGSESQCRLLREVQALETRALLEWLCREA